LLRLSKTKKGARFQSLAKVIREVIFIKYVERLHQGGQIERRPALAS